MSRQPDLRRFIIQLPLLIAVVAVASMETLTAAQSVPGGVDRLTGCLDEQPGPTYVLRNPQDLHLLSSLEPVGFPVQDFAKYLGQKVTVSGSRTSKDGATLMKVRNIKVVSKSCTASGAATAPPAASKSSKEVTASGCLDEDPGPQYTLRGDQELKLLMELEPDGFPAQNFARYLGHRVELRGTTYTQDQKTVMKVKVIKDMADSCTPR